MFSLGWAHCCIKASLDLVDFILTCQPSGTRIVQTMQPGLLCYQFAANTLVLSMNRGRKAESLIQDVFQLQRWELLGESHLRDPHSLLEKKG